jgi:hypothetical protein
MINILYKAIERYFTTLSQFGYKSYDDVYKLLFFIAVTDFVYSDVDAAITEDDYRDIEKALYCIFGTTCLLPYPEYCNKKQDDMNNLHLGDITDLAYQICNLEEESVNKEITEIQNTVVVKPGVASTITVDNIPNL